MPAPALVPVYILYSFARLWILKPMGVLFKAVTFGNTVKVYRVIVGIRQAVLCALLVLAAGIGASLFPELFASWESQPIITANPQKHGGM